MKKDFVLFDLAALVLRHWDRIGEVTEDVKTAQLIVAAVQKTKRDVLLEFDFEREAKAMKLAPTLLEDSIGVL